MNKFEFDIMREVVDDFADDILNDMAKVLDDKKIELNNKNDILVKLYDKVIDLQQNIITSVKNEKELEEVNIKLKFINEFLKEI